MGAAMFGHIIPKYAISHIDGEIMSQCVDRTFEKVPLALLDWKGIKSEDKTSFLLRWNPLGCPTRKFKSRAHQNNV